MENSFKKDNKEKLERLSAFLKTVKELVTDAGKSGPIEFCGNIDRGVNKRNNPDGSIHRTPNGTYTFTILINGGAVDVNIET